MFLGAQGFMLFLMYSREWSIRPGFEQSNSKEGGIVWILNSLKLRSRVSQCHNGIPFSSCFERTKRRRHMARRRGWNSDGNATFEREVIIVIHWRFIQNFAVNQERQPWASFSYTCEDENEWCTEIYCRTWLSSGHFLAVKKLKP